MTAFGNFAPFDTGSADRQTGNSPADIGLGGKGNSYLVEQALAMSPANFAGQTENKTLRSVMNSGAFASPRAADATTNSRAADLIDLLSSPTVTYDARTTAPQPVNNYSLVNNPFSLSPSAYPVETTNYGQAKVQPFYPEAKVETGPLPAVKQQTEALTSKAPVYDVKSNPLFALINKDAKNASAYNYNARMDSTGIEALSRQIMPVDFTAPKAWAAPEAARGKSSDPFAADNCDQSMEFRHDGSVVTTTTLPDRSASKVETVNLDRSKSIALTDAQGRTTVEQKFDQTGHLVCQTNSRYEHASSPLVASHKIVQTATQAIETRMNESGAVIASKIVPAGDLSANKSLA